MPQHGDLRVVFAARPHARIALVPGFLVGPVRRHAVLGMVVHFFRADLDLDRLAGLAVDHLAHHGVQRLVAVGLGPRDVVVELFVDGLEVRVHPGQRGIAVLHVRHHHAQCEDVEDLLEVERLAAHLLDDAVNVLRASLHRGLDAFGLQFVLQLRAQLLDVTLALDALLVEQPCDQLVGVGFE
ncbi:hypothetical protein D9M69_542430 [compost metagenome]